MKDSEDQAPSVQSSSRWSSSPDAPRRTGPINQDHGTSLKTRCTTLVPMPSFLPNLP